MTSTRILYCRKCEKHGLQSILKGHNDKCPYSSCSCKHCLKLDQKRMKTFEKRNKNQIEKAKCITQMKQLILDSYPELLNHPDAELYIAEIQTKIMGKSDLEGDNCKSCPPFSTQISNNTNNSKDNNLRPSSALATLEIHKQRRREDIVSELNNILDFTHLKMDSNSNIVAANPILSNALKPITVPSTSMNDSINRKRPATSNNIEFERLEVQRKCMKNDDKELSKMHESDKNDGKYVNNNDKVIELPTIPPINVMISEIDQTIKIMSLPLTPKPDSLPSTPVEPPAINALNDPENVNSKANPSKIQPINPILDQLGQPQPSTLLMPNLTASLPPQTMLNPTTAVQNQQGNLHQQSMRNIGMINGQMNQQPHQPLHQRPVLLFASPYQNQLTAQTSNGNQFLGQNQPRLPIQNQQILNFVQPNSISRSNISAFKPPSSFTFSESSNKNQYLTQTMIPSDLELKRSQEQALTSMSLMEQIQRQQQQFASTIPQNQLINQPTTQLIPQIHFNQEASTPSTQSFVGTPVSWPYNMIKFNDINTQSLSTVLGSSNNMALLNLTNDINCNQMNQSTKGTISY